MNQPLSISSAANPRVKALVRLRQRADERRTTGRFTIETLRELQRAVDAGFSLVELYACEALLGENSGAIAQICAQARITPVAVTDNVLRKIAYRENPQGFIAVLAAQTAPLDQLDVDSPALVIVLSGLEKPGNVGAIARTAEAAGCSAIFIDAPDFDLFNPNAIRASTGALFGLPVVCDTAEHLRDWLAEKKIITVALTPEAQMTHLHMTMRHPIALVVGTEDRGLDEFWKSHADLQCAIPMQGRVADSLNVSVSAAVMLFEAMRQRTS